MYLLAGFDATMFEGFKSQGCEIGAWIQVVEKKHKLARPEGVETYSWKDFTLCNLPGVFAHDMDPELARRVREQAYPYFVRMQDRMYWYNFERVDTWIDTVNILDSMIHFFYSLLKRNQISHVISSNLPHEGPHIILYYVAKEMGLENILLTQSLVPNAFWIMGDFKDFGIFASSVASVGIEIPVTEEPEMPFYMSEAKGNQLLNSARFIAKHATKTIINFAPYLIGYRKRSFKKSLFKLDQRRRVDQIMNSLNYDDVKEGEKYIYFPLHLQPEMTTDTLGHEYCDQLLAIEELVRKLPEDVHIYVKENPKQSGQMREDSFYKRMRTFPRVKYLKRDVNSFHLIEKSMGIATITGTAGWEALQMKKPVITFGSAWYRAIPGVFEWNSEFNFEMIEKFSFDRRKFNDGVRWLGQYLRQGVVDEAYVPLVEDFNAFENAKAIAIAVNDFAYEKHVGSSVTEVHNTA